MGEKDWMEWFNLKGDPFTTTPLQDSHEFDNLLVVTDSMERELYPFIEHFKHLASSITLLIGERGIGKSTLLHYCLTTVRERYNVLPVYAGIHVFKAQKDVATVFRVGEDVLTQSIKEMLNGIVQYRKDLYHENKQLFNIWLRTMGYQYYEDIGVVRSESSRASFDSLREIFLDILRFLKKNNVKTLIVIDNLDKDATIALNYLKGSASQPLFEGINKYGSHVLIAGDPTWEKQVAQDKDLNYLQRRIKVDKLIPTEAYDLLFKRIQDKFDFESTTAFKSPFDRVTIAKICKEKKGITRDIIIAARESLRAAFSLNVHKVTSDEVAFAEKMVSYSDAYYELTNDSRCVRSFAGLFRIQDELSKDPDSLRKALNFLIRLYRGEDLIRADDEVLELLHEFALVQSFHSRYGKDWGLSVLTKHLFECIEERGYSLEEFLDIFFTVGERDFIRTKIRSIDIIEPALDGLLASISKKTWPSEMIQISDSPNISTKKRNIHGQIIGELNAALVDYRELTFADPEAIDYRAIVSKIHAVLFNYIGAFCKDFILNTGISISGRPYDWSFRFQGLRTFQIQYNVQLATYWKVTSLKSLGDSSFLGIKPKTQDVRNAQEWLEDILVEYSNHWIQKFHPEVKEIHPQLNAEVKTSDLSAIVIQNEIKTVIQADKSKEEEKEVLKNAISEIEETKSPQILTEMEKRERAINRIFEIASNSINPSLLETFQFRKNFLWDFLNSLKEYSKETDLDLEEDLVESIFDRDQGNFELAYSKGGRALEEYAKLVGKTLGGLKDKKILDLKKSLKTIFRGDKELSSALEFFSKFNAKAPKESLRTIMSQLLRQKKVANPYWDKHMKDYMRHFCIAVLIRNYVAHHRLPKKKPFHVDDLLTIHNSILISILQILFSNTLVNLFTQKKPKVKKISDTIREVHLSNLISIKVSLEDIKSFIHRYKEESVIQWHLCQGSTIENVDIWIFIGILGILAGNEWIAIKPDILSLKILWTKTLHGWLKLNTNTLRRFM